VWLVEQFRYTVQERAWELPQGGWEEAVVDPEDLARGELKEETGLHAERMVRLGALWIAYGFARQKQHVFLASGLKLAETDRDAEEHDLVVRSFALGDFERMMREGTIADASTLAAWGLYQLRMSGQK
jgi:8-oxo-dGTP pyrophosphatase MutT (NUDIX family)